MFAQLINAQKVSDKVSVGISVLCLFHCLLFPSLMVALSSFVSLTLNSELIHYMLLFLVVPISSFALIVGLNNHKNSFIFVVGLLGLAILVSALLLELPIKIISGEILVFFNIVPIIQLFHLWIASWILGLVSVQYSLWNKSQITNG